MSTSRSIRSSPLIRLSRLARIVATIAALLVFVASSAVVALSVAGAHVPHSFTFWTSSGECEISVHDKRMWLDNDPQIFFDSAPQRLHKEQGGKLFQRLAHAQDAQHIAGNVTEAADADRAVRQAYADIGQYMRR